MKALSKEIKLLGLSTEEFGKEIGVSRQSVYNWLKDKVNPKAKHIKRMREIGISEEAALNPSKEVEV